MHKGDFIKCVQVSCNDTDVNCNSYGYYIKRGIIWIKSTEIVTLKNIFAVKMYESWKDAKSENSKFTPVDVINITLSNGKELDVLNTEEFDMFA